jgi:2-dehydro-3-deoxy-D-arabinonate dehydratase
VEPAPRRPHLIAPIDAPEIWGAGITYRRSADYYTPHQGRAKGIYDHVYESKRPELFFKATMSRAVGPNGTICVRRDSSLTAVEPELALVMGRAAGSSPTRRQRALGVGHRAREPAVPAAVQGVPGLLRVRAGAGEGDRDPGPHTLDFRCTIHRRGAVLWKGEVNTREIHSHYDLRLAGAPTATTRRVPTCRRARRWS